MRHTHTSLLVPLWHPCTPDRAGWAERDLRNARRAPPHFTSLLSSQNKRTSATSLRVVGSNDVWQLGRDIVSSEGRSRYRPEAAYQDRYSPDWRVPV